MSEQVGLGAYESEEVRTRITDLIECEIAPVDQPHSYLLALWKRLVQTGRWDELIVGRPPVLAAFQRALAAVDEWKRLWAGRPLPSAPLNANEEELEAPGTVAEEVLGVDFYIFWAEVFQCLAPRSKITGDLEWDLYTFRTRAENDYAGFVKSKEADALVGV